MTVTLVSYASPKKDYLRLQDRLHSTSTGFDDHHKYGRQFLAESGFIDKHGDLFSDNSKGDGYWSWKPYIILDAMNLLTDGDLVIYSDVDYLLKPELIQVVQKQQCNGFFIVQNNMLNILYTKKYCFHVMNCNDEEYYNIKQMEAGCCAFVKCKETIELLNEWLEWCTQYGAVSCDSMQKKEHAMFREHRHDQSILTNLVLKHQLPTVRIEDVFDVIEYEVS